MKQIFYFINYEKVITAIGDCNPSYMKNRGYAIVTKEEYENYINNNQEYLKKMAKLLEVSDEQL